MDRLWNASPRTPDRLAPPAATFLAVLSLSSLAIALGGFFLYTGWQRVAYVTAFVAMGLANLAWAAGSLLPEGRLGRVLRIATGPLAVIMMLALGAALAFQFGCSG